MNIEARKGWFGMNQRHRFATLLILDGDYEKNIKSFGVKKFVQCIESLGVSLS